MARSYREIPTSPVKTKFSVELTEYDLGWGSRPFATVYFHTEADAQEYAASHNAEENTATSAPDWYVVAEYRYVK